jgi:hypothetical protein
MRGRVHKDYFHLDSSMHIMKLARNINKKGLQFSEQFMCVIFFTTDSVYVQFNIV